MIWNDLYEKFGKNQKSVIITCNPDDKNDDFINQKVQTYKNRGLRVVVKNIKRKETNNSTENNDEE